MALVPLSKLNSPHFEVNSKLWMEYHPHIAEKLLQDLHFEEVFVEPMPSGGYVAICPDPLGKDSTVTVHATRENVSKHIHQFASAIRAGSDFILQMGSQAGASAVATAHMVEQCPFCVLLIVEPVRPMLWVASFFHDLSSVLKSSRVFWAVGPDIRQSVNDVLDDQKLSGFVQGRSVIPPGDGDYYRHNYAALAEAIDKKQRWLVQSWHQRCVQYGKRHALQHNPYKRAAFFVPRLKSSWLFEVTAEALIRGLRAASVEVETLDQYRDRDRLPSAVVLEVLDKAPDFLLSMNTPASRSLGVGIVNALRLPQVIWYIDNPHFWPYRKEGEPGTQETAPRPCDVLMCYDPGHLNIVRTWGAEHTLYLPHAADFIDLHPPRNDLACDVAFIGSVFDQREQLAQLPAALRDFIRELVEETFSRFFTTPLSPPDFGGRVLKETLPKGVEADPALVSRYVYLEVNNRIRLEAIRRLLPFDLHIYGQSYWKDLLGEKDAARCYKGMVDYEESSAVMASARVNLDVTSIQTHASLGPRCFNVVAQRGCLLTDWRDGLDHLLQHGEGVLYYESWDGIPAFVEECLEDPEKREEIVEKGRTRILREHTFQHRAETILSYLNENRRSIEEACNREA